MEIPSTLYVAVGAVAAALVAGFFSFLNLVSSKENKVSEFRQSWIDGLRNEISVYASSLQALVRFKSIQPLYEYEKEWIEKTKDIYKDAGESLTKIQLRLNPEQVIKNPDSHEAKLIDAINLARKSLNDDDLDSAFSQVANIREAAAPFLKEEWERVKNGEERYQKIRDGAQRTIRLGIILLVLFAITLFSISF